MKFRFIDISIYLSFLCDYFLNWGVIDIQHKFQVCNLMIWYLRTVLCNDRNNSSWHLSSCISYKSFLVWWQLLRFILLAASKYVIQYMFLNCSHHGTRYTLMTFGSYLQVCTFRPPLSISHTAPHPASGNRQSIPCVYELHFFLLGILHVRKTIQNLSLSGLFHLA